MMTILLAAATTGSGSTIPTLPTTLDTLVVPPPPPALPPPEPAAVVLQAQVNASIAAAAPHLAVAPAEYYFNRAPLVLSQAVGFTLDGTGSASGAALPPCQPSI